MPISTLTSRATIATWWSSLEIASRYGAQIVVTIILARLLTPADFGLMAMLLVFTSIGAILIDAGFGAALVQRKHTTLDDETTVFAFGITTGIVVALILWFSAPFIANFYKQPELIALTHLVVLILPLGALASVPDALLTKRLNFAARTQAQIIASSLSGALAIALALAGFGVWSVAWQAVAAMALRAALLWHYANWSPRGRLTQSAFKSLFGFGGFLLLSSLLDTITLRLQTLLLGRFFDASTLGYYTLAQNAQQAPTSFMGTLLNRVGLPVFSQVADQPKKLQGALRLSLRTSLFLFLPCMIGLALAAKPLISIVYGSRWEQAAPILTLLSLAAAFWPLHVLNLAALTAQGRSDLFFQLEVIKKIISIALIVASSPFGPTAVAAAVLVTSFFGIVINSWHSRRLLNYGLMAQLSDQKLTFALCMMAAAVAWAILHWTARGTLPTLAAVGVAALIYIAGAHLFRSEALSELILIGKNLFDSWHAKKHKEM